MACQTSMSSAEEKLLLEQKLSKVKDKSFHGYKTDHEHVQSAQSFSKLLCL